MNGVYETTTTSGTGDLTLAAVAGRPRFDDVGVGEVVPYAMKDGNNWEWAMGTVGASNTLVRSTILATYVSGVYDNTSPTAITLSGSQADVYLSPLSDAISPTLPVVSGAFGRKGILSSAWSTYPSGSIGVTANRLYLIPFKVDALCDVNGFYIDMATAGAASTIARLGLYRIKADGQPGDLIIETGDIDTSVTALVLSPAVNQTRIKPGWYYVGLVCSGTPVFTGYPAAAYCQSPLGLTSNAGDFQPIQFVYKTIAGWTGLPVDPTGFSNLAPGVSAFPAVALKLV